VGQECWSTVHHGGSWVPSLQIFMLRSRLANKLHDTWRDMPEQIGSAMWLGPDFTSHPSLLRSYHLPVYDCVCQGYRQTVW